jgi:peroxiredoxin
MPGHTYTGLHRYREAAHQQEASARVDHAYMFSDRVMPFEIHNYAHNNQWLCTTYSHLGRVADAVAVARNLVEQPRDPEKNNVQDGGSAQRSGRIRWAEVLSRYELWDELIAATASGALDWSEIPIERMQKSYFLGQAYAARKDQTRLAEQIALLKTNDAADAKAALAELEGYSLLSQGKVGDAFDRFGKAGSMRTEALARAHLFARNYGFAESIARQAEERNPNQLAPLAALVEILHACGKDSDAQAAYRRLEPLTKCADQNLPVLRRLEPIVSGWRREKERFSSGDSSACEGISAAQGELATLGHLLWSPYCAGRLIGTDTTGKTWNLSDLKNQGKSVLVLFFLGGKCVHCMQQLQVFGKEYDALKKMNVEVIAVGTDDAASTKALKENAAGVKFPMPLLADPGLEHFKRFGVFDDFENQPLHGCFLIDAPGGVRYQRISYEPFLDVEFVKSESARVNRLMSRKENP